jgi:hypothetical protein
MTTRHRLAAAALVAAVATGMTGLPASPASAVVLTSTPQSRLEVGGHLKVGVWYGSWDGGPRAYRVKVVNPDGDTVFRRCGKAPSHWRTWRVHVHRVGVYRTIYRTKDKDGHWIRSVFRTRVHR